MPDLKTRLREAVEFLVVQDLDIGLAAFFTESRVTGKKMSAAACPISTWLKGQLGCEYVGTSHLRIIAEDGEARAEMVTPKSFQPFMNAFDNGHHPQLERLSAPQPA